MKITRVTPAKDRLLARLEDQPNGCKYWTGYINKDGYGRVGYRGCSSVPVYRAVYEEFVGSIPEGMQVDHTCHTEDESCPGGKTCMHRRCANPNHLELVTSGVNTLRGRSFSAKNAVKTECHKGHPYDDANTYINKGTRYCIACWTARTGHPPRRQEAA